MVCLSIGARLLRNLDGSTGKEVSMHGVCAITLMKLI